MSFHHFSPFLLFKFPSDNVEKTRRFRDNRLRVEHTFGILPKKVFSLYQIVVNITTVFGNLIIFQTGSLGNTGDGSLCFFCGNPADERHDDTGRA